jgi:hypothetical protein
VPSSKINVTAERVRVLLDVALFLAVNRSIEGAIRLRGSELLIR